MSLDQNRAPGIEPLSEAWLTSKTEDLLGQLLLQRVVAKQLSRAGRGVGRAAQGKEAGRRPSGWPQKEKSILPTCSHS